MRATDPLMRGGGGMLSDHCTIKGTLTTPGGHKQNIVFSNNMSILEPERGVVDISEGQFKPDTSIAAVKDLSDGCRGVVQTHFQKILKNTLGTDLKTMSGTFKDGEYRNCVHRAWGIDQAEPDERMLDKDLKVQQDAAVAQANNRNEAERSVLGKMYDALNAKISPNLKEGINLEAVKEEAIRNGVAKVIKGKTADHGLKYATNAYFCQLQFRGVSGFDLEGKNTQFDKNTWHQNMLKDISMPEAFLFCSEDYLPDVANQTWRNGETEFTIYSTYSEGGTAAAAAGAAGAATPTRLTGYDKSTEGKIHAVTVTPSVGQPFTVANVHCASGKSTAAVTAVADSIQKYKGDVVLGGDSNVYYSANDVTLGGKRYTRAEEDGNGDSRGTDDIGALYNKIKETHRLWICKDCVYKKRPDNFFENAQTAFKCGEDDPPEETMIILVPRKDGWDFKPATYGDPLVEVTEDGSWKTQLNSEAKLAFSGALSDE